MKKRTYGSITVLLGNDATVYRGEGDKENIPISYEYDIGKRKLTVRMEAELGDIISININKQNVLEIVISPKGVKLPNTKYVQQEILEHLIFEACRISFKFDSQSKELVLQCYLKADVAFEMISCSKNYSYIRLMSREYYKFLSHHD